MCLILLAHKAHPRYPLVLAANRDEQYTRATAPAAFWDDDPKVYGGRDLVKGGSWLGTTLYGRVAAITNYREGGVEKTSNRSRGELVGNFLHGNQPATDYLDQVARDGSAYNGFNLIVGDVETLHYISNRGMRASPLTPGVHGLSNNLLDTPWPKVERGKRTLSDLLHGDTANLAEGLFAALAGRITAPDQVLPDTGVGLDRERMLAPAFIVSDIYGTRASTVVLVDNNGEIFFEERSFVAMGRPGSTVTKRFTLATATAIGTAA